jgi:hypothetical protein
MRRAGLAGVRPDTSGALFPPSMKINHTTCAAKALAPSKRLYNFPNPALCCQLAPNQRTACQPALGWGIAAAPDMRLSCALTIASRSAKIAAA